MKDKKFWLYLLLGMLLFSLWDAWHKEHSVELKAENQTVAKVDEGTNFNGMAVKFGEVPPVALAAKEMKLVKVDTDVLAISIDLRGGGIVESVLKQYPIELNSNEPVKLLNNNADEGYLARSGILDVTSQQTYELVEYVTTKTHYLLTGEELEVILKGVNSRGIEFQRKFIFKRGHYDFKVEDQVDNRTKHSWTGKFYAEIERKIPKQKKSWLGLNTYMGAAISSKDKPYEKIPFSVLEKRGKNSQKLRDIQGGWLAMQQRYFLNVWIPNSEEIYHYFGYAEDHSYTIGLYSDLLTLSPGMNYKNQITFYTGPDLAKNTSSLAKGLDRTADYGWLWIISIGLFKLLTWCYSVIGNWGVAIILVTILIKLVFYKLSESSCRSMAKMKDLMPKMNLLKEKYGNDNVKLQQAMMELYRQEKINPLNFGGCIPMLVQIPFFIALYYVLIGAVELRHAPFLGWIRDLSAQDPFYILPILMGLTMFLQQKLSPSSVDSTQAKMMLFMPVFFTLLFARFPAGLVLYWVSSNLLSIGQQWYINRKMEQEKQQASEQRAQKR